jgi:CRP/FNR family transcriptional regulator
MTKESTEKAAQLRSGCEFIKGQVREAARLAGLSKLPPPCRDCATRGNCPAAFLIATSARRSDAPSLHSLALTRREHVFLAGEAAEALYVVRAGSVKTYMTTGAGDEHVVTFYMAGDVIGLDALATKVHQSSAVALEAAAVCAMPFNELEKFVEHSPHWLYSVIASELVRDQHTLMVLNKKSAESRLAGFLIDLSERFRARGYSARQFNLSMGRQDIGNHLGLAVETVSRLLTRMQQEGLLEVEGRQITICDPDNLHAMAEVRSARS